MTREENIKWLESLKAEIGKSEHRSLWHYAEALDMAIEALKELPKRRKEAKRWKRKALQQERVNTLNQIPEACKNCSNHPSNGGSGICFCTLGSMTTTR